MKKYCIGIDGGGTKTLAYLADLEGNIVDKTLLGPSNFYSIGEKETMQVFASIISVFVEKNQLKEEDLVFTSMGLAGVDREVDKKTIYDIWRKIGFKGDIYVYNDAHAALVGGLQKTEGIILVSGTGSIATGLRNGKLIRSGGWGHILSDQGSGYDIGLKGLQAVMASYDQRLGKTLMTHKVLDELNINHPEDVISFVHHSDTDKSHIANMAKVVIDSANEGDQIAKSILEGAWQSLVLLSKAVIGQLYHQDERIEMTYMGGIITNVDLIREPFVQKMQSIYPYLTIKKPAQDAAIGALLLGQSEHNR